MGRLFLLLFVVGGIIVIVEPIFLSYRDVTPFEIFASSLGVIFYILTDFELIPEWYLNFFFISLILAFLPIPYFFNFFGLFCFGTVLGYFVCIGLDIIRGKELPDYSESWDDAGE